MRLTVDDRGTTEELLRGGRGQATSPLGWAAGSRAKRGSPIHRNLRRCLLALLLALAIGLPALANQAENYYKEGQKAEAKNDFDGAYKAYVEASKLEPKNAKYLAAVTRLKFYAAMQHLHAGIELRESGKLNDAAVEFERAVAIDPTSMVAKAELQKTADMIQVQSKKEQAAIAKPQSPLAGLAASLEGPIEFHPTSSTPINMRMSSNADQIYKVVGKLAGFNVLFDPDFKPQRISVELNDVTAREALSMVSLESKTFYQPISANTIIVAADTAAKRKEYEHTAMKMFFMRNASSPADLQEASKTIGALLDLTRVQLVPAQNAMIFRGTRDQLVLAEKLLADLDKPKPEVVIEVAVLEVDRNRLRTIGTNPPTSVSIQVVPPGTSATVSGGTSNGNSFTLNTIGKVTGNDVLLTIPGASLSFLMSDSNTKVIQNPQVRAMDNEHATLKIGDRVPVATGSFAPGTGGGISPLVSTQFQYLDVGVNVDITPHIHSDHEVTLKMNLEVSSVTGQTNIGGISQPIIGQRTVQQQARLGDGEVSLIAGILEDTDTKSLGGYPYLSKIPVLKYLFAQEDKEREETEVVFAITPHIVRSQDVTEDNLRLVDVGTGTNVGIRVKEPAKAQGDGAANTTQPKQQPVAQTPQPPAQPASVRQPQQQAPPPTPQAANPPPRPLTQVPPHSGTPQ
jgi:general secretion pathway protein D